MPLPELILALAVLLALAMLAAGIGRVLPIPWTVLLVLVGTTLGGTAQWLGLGHLLAPVHLTPEVVLFGLLPALIFESALALDARELVRNLAPVLTLAIPALLLSTLMVALGVHLLLGLGLGVALLFGAMISATDPVAVVALFREIGAPARLTTLVEGESLLNDATAIVLVQILLLAVAGTAAHGGAADAVGAFARVFVGGALLGTALGAAATWMMRWLHPGWATTVVLSMALAWGSFAVAEHGLHVSGVMAALAAALTVAALGVAWLPQATLHLVRETWEVVALACNALLFLLIGLSVSPALLLAASPAIAVAWAVVMAARALGVYPLIPAATRLFRLPPVRPAERHIIWLGGLKGGLAIAIVLSLPEMLPARDQLVVLTLGVVVATLVVNAPTIHPLMRWLGMDRPDADERIETARALELAADGAGTLIGRLQRSGLLPPRVADDLGARIAAAFRTGPLSLTAAQRRRRAHLEALRLEFDALESLHALDLIDQYTYLDLRTTLQRDRERWRAGQVAPGAARPSPFQRLEAAVVGSLREVDLAAPLLARYQRTRLAQRLQRDCAGVLTADAVLEALGDGDEATRAVRETYRQRRERRHQRLQAVQRDFPAYFDHWAERFVARAALAAAGHAVARAGEAGSVGAKARGTVERRIAAALAALPPLPAASAALSARGLLAGVPAFRSLPASALDALVDHAQLVDFVPGDVVIAEGQRGNALYVVAQGRVAVERRDGAGATRQLAELGPGEFFGETALLGDDQRTATVRALGAVTLLRLTRNDVRSVAAREPELARHLDAVRSQRAAAP